MIFELFNRYFVRVALVCTVCFAAPAMAWELAPDEPKQKTPQKIELLQPESLQRQAVEALRNSPSSPFQNLKEKFESGRSADEKSFSERLSGRCYFSDRPMQPIAAVLTFSARSDDGPAFKGMEYKKIMPFISKSSAAGFFDSPSSSTLAELDAMSKKHRDDFTYPVNSNGSVISSIPRTMTLQARSYHFRKDKSYLVMKTVCEDHGGCKSPHEYDRWMYEENEDVAFCYFFKPS